MNDQAEYEAALTRVARIIKKIRETSKTDTEYRALKKELINLQKKLDEIAERGTENA